MATGPMRRLLHKTWASAREEGLAAAAGRIATFVTRSVEEKRRWKRILAHADRESRFTAIWRENAWGSPDSVSGPGSSLAYTAALRARLPALFAERGITRVFDAPCGDFGWMAHVLAQAPVDYVGADIVAPMIEVLNRTHGRPGLAFRHMDIAAPGARFPEADLMICRDCLFHLSYADTLHVLDNAVASGIPLLLTTTHVAAPDFRNADVETGAFRLIDLFADPYGFPAAPLETIADSLPPDRPRVMVLFEAAQVRVAAQRLGAVLGA